MRLVKLSAATLILGIASVALLLACGTNPTPTPPATPAATPAPQATPSGETPEPTATPASARDLEAYFRGKTITVMVGSAPGGSYDFFGRMLSIYGSQYLPGQPRIIVQNLTGAGGARALRTAYERPHDGLTIGTISPTLVQQVVLGEDLGVPGFDLATIRWVGGTLNVAATGMVASRTDVATNWDEALALGRPLIAGASTPGGRNTVGAEFMALLGGPIRMVYGYGGNAEIFPALDRRELEAIGVGRAVPRLFPEWHEADPKFISFLYYWGPHPSEDPDMQGILDLYGADAPIHIGEAWDISEQHMNVLNVANGLSDVVSNSFYVPHGVPDDVHEAWVEVFARMVENPEYTEISANAGYTTALATPQDIERVLEVARGLSPEALDFYRVLAIDGAQ